MSEGRVALFGGTFDPPHVGHLIVAEYAASALGLSRVIWMPCASPPHKSRTGISAASDRLAMVRMAIEGNDRFVWSRGEIDRGGKSYTVETLRGLHASNPDWDIFLLVGSDNWEGFGEKWYRPAEVIALAKPIVYPRGEGAPETGDTEAVILSAPLIMISSTQIRRRVEEGVSVRYMVTDAVGDYIKRNSLYRLDD